MSGHVRQKAFLLASQAIREELIKRFDPTFMYMKESPYSNPNFRREVLNRAIFETLSFSHGDKGVIREILAELKARGYPWIDLSLANADIDWIIGEKAKWLGLLNNQLSVSQLNANAPVNLQSVPLPQAIWITTGTGIHPAFKSFSSNDLPMLREEVQSLNKNLQGFDLSTQTVSDALRFTLENPPEQNLRLRLQSGEILKPELFYARLWEAVFVNMEKIQGDNNLLSNALDDLVGEYPDVAKAKPWILNDLHNIKRQRVAWFDKSVLPRLWECEHPQPRAGQVAVASPNYVPEVLVRLPKTAWILKDPGLENIPEVGFVGFSSRKAENDLLRSMP